MKKKIMTICYNFFILVYHNNMIRKEYYKACDIFIENIQEKRKNEFFNEYGYNLFANRRKPVDHFKMFSYTNQNNVKKKPKR
ncbi:MAG: hypothetical protein E7164_01450 [Firmicutes bacterium]|nr:hypothetical protein [Bacillota bacterium]